LKLKQNFSYDFGLWYYRDTNGTELDFLLETSEGLLGGEIKLAMTLSKNHLKNLQKESLNLNLKQGIIVSLFEKEIPVEPGIYHIPWNRIVTLFEI
jgi:predicted AAA+ superfamily ATPase